MLRCGCPGTIHCRLPSTEPGSFFIQSNSIFWRPNSSYSFFDEPPVHTVFNSCQRLLAVDRDRPAVVEGLRILRRVLTEIKKRTGATDTRLLLLIVPMRESAYSELARGQAIAPPASYTRLVTMEKALHDTVVEICHAEQIQYADALPPLQQALATGRPAYHASLNGHPCRFGQGIYAETALHKLNKLKWLA